MACRTIKLGAGVTAIVCGPRGRRQWCSIPGCHGECARLCDFPLLGKKAGKTCDAKVCRDHATSVGTDLDYCPAHARLHAADQAALARLLEETDARYDERDIPAGGRA
jgi:hypothetical protein